MLLYLIRSHYFVLLNLLAFTLPAIAIETPMACQKAFESVKISPGLACVYDCTVMPQSTKEEKICPLFCSDMCQSNYFDAGFFKLTELYPGLTASERAIAVENPFLATKAYALSLKAEKYCITKYFIIGTSDESDACRHFVWASLMVKHLGSDFAMRVLEAHEAEISQPSDQRAMDMANNRTGVLLSQQLIAKNKYSDDALIEEFESALKLGKIVVLKVKRK